MIKVIGFDLDDTLWDVAPIIIGAEAQLDEWLQNKVPDLKFTVTSMRKLNHQVLEEDPGLIKKITEFRRRTIKTALSLSGIPEAQS
ncbi:MAG: HAD family hydrolase, partial [Pseudomonadales bacterium]|nr:HAD family hydrolase [Pseudomonadales bacterium]